MATQSVALSSAEFKLELIDVPKPRYNRGRGWVLLGASHEFMPKILALVRKSPTAAAIMARAVALTAGDGFKANIQALPALGPLLKNVARSGKYRTANKLWRRAVEDYKNIGAMALQVVWAQDGLHIAELHHQRIETVASGPLNDEGEVENYWICRDWSKQGQYPPKEIPAYSPERAKMRKPPEEGQQVGDLLEPVQLLYYFNESPGVEYYARLFYEAALPYIEMEADLAQFHGTNVASNFAAQTIVAINSGPVDTTDEKTGDTITAKSQRDKFETAFEAKYTGPRAKRILYLYGDGTTDAAEKLAKITSIGAGNSEMYTTYAGLAQQAILSAFSCTSPMVAGLPSANGGALGGNGAELYESFKLFFNTACRPDQQELLDVFKELFGRFNGIDFSKEPEEEPWLSIASTLPVEYTFSENLMELIMTDDELRAKINLKPLPAGTKTAADPKAPPAAPNPAAPTTPAV